MQQHDPSMCLPGLSLDHFHSPYKRQITLGSEILIECAEPRLNIAAQCLAIRSPCFEWTVKYPWTPFRYSRAVFYGERAVSSCLRWPKSSGSHIK